MALKQVRLSFAGSFQCRLATNPDPTDSSFSDPFGELRPPPALGWTYDYNEARFDRIIRCREPVQLRSALMDPFEPVKVTSVEVQPEPLFGFQPPFQSLPTDPLVGVPVSLGQAKFDTAAGGGSDAFEAVVGCQLSFGDLARAVPASTPHLAGVTSEAAWTSDYMLRKPVLIAQATATGQIVQTRLKALTQQPILTAPPPRLELYANRFGFRADIEPVKVDLPFSPAGATGVLASLLLGWNWKLELSFSRFDGDTLTGRITGRLSGVHSAL